METFTRLFCSLLLFVYHCFDRVVINGYLSGLSRPGQESHFFHNVLDFVIQGKEFHMTTERRIQFAVGTKLITLCLIVPTTVICVVALIVGR